MWVQKEKSSEETSQGSWVELHFNPADPQGGSQAHIPSGLERDQLEKMLLDAQHESSRSSSKDSSQCNSPLRSLTPPHPYKGSEGHSSQSEEDYQDRRGEVDSPMKKNAADGIWNWSSRPENNPPRIYIGRRLTTHSAY